VVLSTPSPPDVEAPPVAALPEGPSLRSRRVSALRVILAEDSVLVREGIRRAIEADAELELVAVCGDLDSLLAAVDAHRPDVVLTDIRMPPDQSDEGIRAARQLRETHPEVGVVVLSQFDDPAYVIALLGEGSRGRGYLLKDRVAHLDQLSAAIRDVAHGGSVIDPTVVDTLVKARHDARDSPLATLTAREQEVLGEIAQGKSNSAIAASLYLSERAVEKHTNSIFSKLGLAEEHDTNRRVKAVLIWLAEH
jgi:DNA-binding NarL/FixJ family response regulator